MFDIGREHLEYRVELDENLRAEAARTISATDRQLALAVSAPRFTAGERIRHPIMGRGTIEEVDEASRLYMIRFDDLGTVRRISWRIKLESE